MPPRAYEDKIPKNGYCGPEPPRGGLGPLRVESGPTGGLDACASHGGTGPPPQWEGRSGAATCPWGAAAKPVPPRVRWQPAFYVKPVQLPYLMRVVGVCVPEIGYELPTNTLGRYADTTVSPPVTEAARRITAPRRRRACSHITAPRA
jgi:hypothetical protein